jgi:phenylalanyl-tRNA synthetase alpha chain
MSTNGSKLHPIERSLLKALATSTNGRMPIETLKKSANLSIDQTRRGIEWLKYKGLIDSSDRSFETISLGSNGQKAANQGLPERRLVNAVKEGHKSLGAVLKSGLLRTDEINAAIAGAKRNQWIILSELQSKDKLILLTPSAEHLSDEEKLLQKLLKQNNIEVSELKQQEIRAFEFLKRRPDYVLEKKRRDTDIILLQRGKELVLSSSGFSSDEANIDRHLTQQIITSGKWKNTKFSAIDVIAPVPTYYPGRKHPLTDIIDEVKEIFISLGFTEIDGSVVQSGFWNFDVLFTPQDHPAREMQDTFYISGIRQNKFANPKQVKTIYKIHKEGWRYEWNSEEAKRLVLRTHTTPVTIKYLADNMPESARVFSIGRVFRNEKVSYKHLIEFNQVEGILTDRHITLQDLMGLQQEFYSKLGIKKIKFWPTFFPYTEPSLQSVIYNDSLNKWVEMGGMGIFRPEVTQPLGIRNPVLAWGVGIERIAMLRFGLDDVRDLYNNSLSWLRSVPKCQL